MAKFDFKLEALLKHRKRIEDDRRREVAALQRRRNAGYSQVREMQKAITDDKRTLASDLVGRVDVSRIRLHAAHAGRSVVRARQIVQELAGIERQLADTRQRLVRAAAARKAIESLRKKRYEQWRRDRQRRETMAQDEMAVQSFARRRGVVS